MSHLKEVALLLVFMLALLGASSVWLGGVAVGFISLGIASLILGLSKVIE